MKPKKSNSQKKGVFTVDKSVNSREHGLSSDSFEDGIIKEIILEEGEIKPINCRDVFFIEIAIKKARQKEREEILKKIDNLEIPIISTMGLPTKSQIDEALRLIEELKKELEK